jgi:hypothetical protein
MAPGSVATVSMVPVRTALFASPRPKSDRLVALSFLRSDQPMASGASIAWLEPNSLDTSQIDGQFGNRDLNRRSMISHEYFEMGALKICDVVVGNSRENC